MVKCEDVTEHTNRTESEAEHLILEMELNLAPIYSCQLGPFFYGREQAGL